MPALVNPIITAAIAGLVLYAVLRLGRREKELPPGPPTLPIIGNLHQIPTQATFLTFTRWARQYGAIVSLKIGPGTAIVLTSRRLVKQLVDKRGRIYSDRPYSYVSHELISGGDHVLLERYGKRLQLSRKVIAQHFMESIVEKDHLPVQNAEACQLLYDIMTTSEQHMLHPKRFSNSIACTTIWGVRTASVETAHMRRLTELMDAFTGVMEPGNIPPVEMFPILHLVPENLFGNWKSRATRVGRDMNSLYSDMLTGIRKRRDAVGSMNTFMDRVLDQDLDLNDHQLYFLGGTMMEGASDTSAAVILSAILALIRWPEVQKKAQAQIDAWVGEDRSPLWADYEKLPYVAATVKEAQRWRPATPLSVPHAVEEEDWIDGMRIPKGSTVFINVWGLHHDHSRYRDPDRFDPDHFKGVTALAPELAARTDPDDRDHYAYGSGRRMCPGIHLAERNLFLAIAKLLWAFDLSAGDEHDGAELDTDPQTAFGGGLLMLPKPYPLKVVPRSEMRRATIVREYEAAKRDVFAKFGG